MTGLLGFSDAARRVSESMTLHSITDREGNRGWWAAYRLSDGGTDGVLYETAAAAAHAQLHWRQCMYVQVQWDGMSVRDAQIMLDYWRQVYDAGNTPPVLDGYVPVIPATLTPDAVRRVVAGRPRRAPR